MGKGEESSGDLAWHANSQICAVFKQNKRIIGSFLQKERLLFPECSNYDYENV